MGLSSRKLASGRTVWYARLTHEYQPFTFGSFPTKTEARHFLEQVKTEIRQGKFFPDQYRHRGQTRTVQQAIDESLPIARLKKNFGNELVFRTFWGKRLGSRRLVSLTVKDIQYARTALAQRTLKSATINRYTEYLKHILNVEVASGHLTDNPVPKLIPKKLPEPAPPIHQYTSKQEVALIKALGQNGDYVRLAILTGMRQTEQFTLKKEWIRWEDNLISIPDSKSNRARTIYLSTEAKACLLRICARNRNSPWVFCSPSRPHRPLYANGWIKEVFKPACKRARLPETLKWHTLRHTFGSRLAAQGRNEAQIMALGGWATSQAARRYMHLYQADLRQAVEELSHR